MDTLPKLYQSSLGKVSDKWSSYLDVYESVLSEFRSEAICLLEIGIQNGGSLDIWNRYFSNAQILIGCDINPLCANLKYDSPKIKVVVGDATDMSIHAQIESISPNFNVVIDDGSHQSRDIIRAFMLYFPMLAAGGKFIAEDLHCSYWKVYGGGIHYPRSSISFFKVLVDLIHHEHWGIEAKRSDLLTQFCKEYGCEILEADLGKIKSVEFYNSICVVTKEESANTVGHRVISGDEEISQSGIKAQEGSKYAERGQANEAGNIWSTISGDSTTQIDDLTNRMQSLQQDVEKITAANRDLQAHLTALENSRVWRIRTALVGFARMLGRK